LVHGKMENAMTIYINEIPNPPELNGLRLWAASIANREVARCIKAARLLLVEREDTGRVEVWVSFSEGRDGLAIQRKFDLERLVRREIAEAGEDDQAITVLAETLERLAKAARRRMTQNVADERQAPVLR
jgi:hypothetical protein